MHLFILNLRDRIIFFFNATTKIFIYYLVTLYLQFKRIILSLLTISALRIYCLNIICLFYIITFANISNPF